MGGCQYENFRPNWEIVYLFQKKFVEEEARNAVLDMILRAEQIAYENELKRIEQEQMLAEEEEEGAENQYASDLIEEARDKFE
jgi:hypothetical protein